MKLFRVQDPNGEGPFRGKGCNVTWQIERFYHSDWHPLPNTDFSVTHDKVSFCMQYACDSIETLKKWFVFTDELMYHAGCKGDAEISNEARNRNIMHALMNNGYRVAEIDIPDEFCEYGSSLHQVRYDSSEVVGTIIHPIESLYQGHL